MSTHNIGFYEELSKKLSMIINHQIFSLSSPLVVSQFRCERTSLSVFPTRSITNQAVQVAVGDQKF